MSTCFPKVAWKQIIAPVKDAGNSARMGARNCCVASYYGYGRCLSVYSILERVNQLRCHGSLRSYRGWKLLEETFLREGVDNDGEDRQLGSLCGTLQFRLYYVFCL